MNVQEAQFSNWQLSNIKPGAYVEGIESINQCIINILNTKKGTDPLRPDFGTDIFLYIDKPIFVAGPNIQREIIEALTAYEPRIYQIQVTYETLEAGLAFSVAWIYNGINATTRVAMVTKPNPNKPDGVGFWAIEFDFTVS